MVSTYPTYKLGEICDILNGFAFKSSNYVQSGLRVIRITNVKKGYVIDEEPQFYPIETQEELKKYVLKKGDLLISLTGNVGRVGILNEELLPAALNQRVGCLRVKDKSLVSLQYLFHLFNTDSFEKDCINSSKGIAQKNMSTEWLKEYEVTLPPLPTQRAIVTRIETLFAELDKGVEKLKTAQQQLKVYRQAVLNDCLTKGSEKWEKVKLKDICLSISDGDHLPPKRTDKGVPFITISDIKGNSIDFSNVSYMTEEYYENLSQSRKAMVGDILYTVTGSYGIPVLVENNIKFCFQRHIGLIRPNSTIVMQRWLYYMMQSPIIYSQATEKSTGTAQKTVTLSVLRDFELCLPPLPTQQRIVQEIETRLSACDEVEKNIAESLQQAEALRQSILKKAFSGELVASTSSATRKTVPELVEGTDNN